MLTQAQVPGLPKAVITMVFGTEAIMDEDTSTTTGTERSPRGTRHLRPLTVIRKFFNPPVLFIVTMPSVGEIFLNSISGWEGLPLWR